MPPQYSSISCRTVMPAGASFTPGLFTWPDTEKLRRPWRSLRPWPFHQSATFSTMSRIHHSVSMLLISVGRPNRPTWNGYGGLCRGRPRLPSRLSSSDDSRSEEHTSELLSRPHLVCRLLLEKKKKSERGKLSKSKGHSYSELVFPDL